MHVCAPIWLKYSEKTKRKHNLNTHTKLYTFHESNKNVKRNRSRKSIILIFSRRNFHFINIVNYSCDEKCYCNRSILIIRPNRVWHLMKRKFHETNWYNSIANLENGHFFCSIKLIVNWNESKIYVQLNKQIWRISLSTRTIWQFVWKYNQKPYTSPISSCKWMYTQRHVII